MKRDSIPNRLTDVLERKSRGRARAAARPVHEKLAILDAMRNDMRGIGSARNADAVSASDPSKSPAPSAKSRSRP